MNAVWEEGKCVVTTKYPDGSVESAEVPEDNYVLITGPKCYLDHIQKYSNGTVVLTIKTD